LSGAPAKGEKVMKKAAVMAMVAVLALVACALTGCGDSPEQEKRALATDLKSLQASLTELADPDTYRSYETFDRAWTEIQDQYEKVVADAEKLEKTDIADLKKAYARLKNALANVSSAQGLQQKANTILTASREFLTALQRLINSVNPPE